MRLKGKSLSCNLVLIWGVGNVSWPEKKNKTVTADLLLINLPIERVTLVIIATIAASEKFVKSLHTLLLKLYFINSKWSLCHVKLMLH